MQNKIWTILICAYNCESTIANTLDSIIYEGNDDLDVFVVDDGSTQDIKSIVQPFVDKHPNIVHYFRKENGNQGSCINFGIAHANSRYLSLLDSDDIFRKEDFQTVLDLLRKSQPNTDLVVLNFDMVFENGNLNKAIRSKNSKTNKDIEYVPFDKMSLFEFSTIHSSIYSVNLLKQIDPLPEKIGYTDNILYFEVLLRANNIAYLNKKIHLYQYYIRGEKQTINLKNCIKNYDHIVQIYDRILNTNYHKFGKNRFRVSKRFISYHIYWLMAILGNNYNFNGDEKSRAIKDIYAKASIFEKENHCKVKPALTKVLGHTKYGGIYLVKLLYSFLPIKFIQATKLTKAGKKEAKLMAKQIKQNKKQA